MPRPHREISPTRAHKESSASDNDLRSAKNQPAVACLARLYPGKKEAGVASLLSRGSFERVQGKQGYGDGEEERRSM